MACPHVAGAAAVLQQFNKDRTGVALTPAQIKQALVSTGKSVTRSVTKPRIDVWKAMLSLNTAPALSNANVAYTACQQYVFNVTYTDAENNTPELVKFNIDGTFYDMTESDAGDVEKTDGKDYYHNANVAYSSHDFNFTAGEGLVNTTTGIQTFDMSSTVYLSNPTLDNSMGEPTELFNFTVDFTDLCDNPESTVNLTVNNNLEYKMKEVDSGDSDYTDGKMFYVNLTGLPAGKNTHYFTVINDQDVQNISSTITGPRVNTTASCTGDSPPGVGSSSDWDVTQETVCGDSAFIPSSSGMTILQEVLKLNNVTVYSEHEVLNLNGGNLMLNNSVIEFMS
jgi:hypothetical protein